MRKKEPEREPESAASNAHSTPKRSEQGGHRHPVLTLQRTVGNQAVGRLFGLRSIQAKLQISQPGDVYEQEADRVAERVVRGERVLSAPLTALPSIQRDDVSISEAQGLSSVNEALRSSGQPLDAATRAFMEPRFGHDFSQVRVHSGETAEQSAREVNANAYTVGCNIVFATGQFAPGTQEGRWLIAHELTHVVQQSRSGTRRNIDLNRESQQGLGAKASTSDNHQIQAEIRGATSVKIARQPMDPRHARGHAGEQSMGFGYSQDKGWILIEGPSGSGGHGVTTRGFDGVAYNANADELHLIDNKSLKAGTARSATAITKNLQKNLDALVNKVEGMKDMPDQPRILQLLKQTRDAVATGKQLPKNTKLVVTGEGGQVKDVSTSLRKLGVEFREPGTTDLPPAGGATTKTTITDTTSKPATAGPAPASRAQESGAGAKKEVPSGKAAPASPKESEAPGGGGMAKARPATSPVAPEVSESAQEVPAGRPKVNVEIEAGKVRIDVEGGWKWAGRVGTGATVALQVYGAIQTIDGAMAQIERATTGSVRPEVAKAMNAVNADFPSANSMWAEKFHSWHEDVNYPGAKQWLINNGFQALMQKGKMLEAMGDQLNTVYWYNQLLDDLEYDYARYESELSPIYQDVQKRTRVLYNISDEVLKVIPKFPSDVAQLQLWGVYQTFYDAAQDMARLEYQISVRLYEYKQFKTKAHAGRIESATWINYWSLFYQKASGHKVLTTHVPTE
ncbi:MAG: hypothetical protein OJF47_000240 [Nitrospira sp.]|jgi:hypothetical protein|nr:MAG: hypothetical protein OJF47_000240 [Nitrospira sp.]